MKRFTITIPDENASFFIKMMRSISFVKKIEETYPVYVSEEQKDLVRERIKKYENDPESYVEWKDIESKM